MSSIKVDSLTKKFNNFTAVDAISFEVKDGELFGLLGPNGAGKTTTINMLSTLIHPTSGNAFVAGKDVIKERAAVRKSIGIVFQEPALDNKLTGRENLEMHCRMYGINRENRKKKIRQVMELVDLTDKLDVLVEKYSGGMKRRLEISRGLTHEPKVLFLDEPTLGLDAQTRRHIWDYVKKLNVEKGVSIMLTSHYMEEADYLCDRIAIMDHGTIVALDTPKKLKDLLGGDTITLELEGNKELLIDKFKNLAWIKKYKVLDNLIYITVEQGEKKIPELIALAQSTGLAVNSVNLRKPSLEDVFLHFTGKTIREEEASEQKPSRRRGPH